MQRHELAPHTDVESLLQAHSAAILQMRVLCMSPGRYWIHQQSCEALTSIYTQALQKLTNMLAAPLLSSHLHAPHLQLLVQPALDMVLAAILRGKRFIESCRPPTTDRVNFLGGSPASSYRSHWRGSSSASFAKSSSQVSSVSTDRDALDVLSSEIDTIVDDKFWLYRALLKGHVNDAINVHLHDFLIAFSAVGAAIDDSNAQYMPQIYVSRRMRPSSADLALPSPDLFWKEQNKLPHVLLVSAQHLDHVQNHDDAFLDSQLENAMNLRGTLDDADTTQQQNLVIVNDAAQLAAFVKEKIRCAKQGSQASISPRFLLDINQLEEIDMINMDPFNTSVVVHKVMWLGREFALKVYKKGMKEKFLQEAEIHVRLHHPNVVHAIALFMGERRYGILIELMDESLKIFLHRHAFTLRLQEKVSILLQIAEGMAYVHGQGVIHRDIKPSNVLVRSSMDPETSNIPQLEVKVADFGESRSRLPDAASSFKTKKVGTTVYRAPEVLNEDTESPNFTLTYKKSADVYSFAMTCFELLAEKEPFHDAEKRQALWERVLKGERPDLESISDAACPPYLKHCLEVWWAADPKTRHSFTQICCILRHLYACLARCRRDTEPMEQFPFLAWPFWRWRKAQDIAQERLNEFEIRRTDDDWKDKGYLCESTRVNDIPYQMHVMNWAIKMAATDHEPGVATDPILYNLPNQKSTRSESRSPPQFIDSSTENSIANTQVHATNVVPAANSDRSTPGKSFGQKLKEFCCFSANIIPSTHEAFHDDIRRRNL